MSHIANTDKSLGQFCQAQETTLQRVASSLQEFIQANTEKFSQLASMVSELREIDEKEEMYVQEYGA